jgi:dCMP deaminase
MILGISIIPALKPTAFSTKNSKDESKGNQNRPSFQSIYMNTAIMLSKRSTCSRLQVGTVISSPDFTRIMAIGYNGNATGLSNCCDSTEPGNCGCLHSEENAIIKCAEPREVKKIVFVTVSPCVMCAKRLINLGGVEHVYYASRYRNSDGLTLLSSTGIKTTHLVDGVLK